MWRKLYFKANKLVNYDNDDINNNPYDIFCFIL